ncbi:MAG TPA: LysM peptidoglycan-binding domain-containing protein [Pyrinomonadaceae bacterium]|jgi:nucleoid-associated protein YgaU|nr:LysM peptidoglycan-binding domain-containing protein [Pyrinomonadaceae bacterium]
MSLQEKYQSLIDLANSSGISGLNVTEGEGFIRIEGAAPSAEVKQALWDKYGQLDPDYRSGDLVMEITAPEAAANTYTVQSGDNLSKIGSKYGVSWQKIYEANRDKLNDPDKIYPGQELTIPSE